MPRMEGSRIGLVSDTHFPRRAGGSLPPACRAALAGCELIVHAGDHCDMDAVRALRTVGPPVVAVHGNADDAHVRALLPATATFDRHGVRVTVTHDAGPAAGRLARLRRRFPDAGVVVFGHSHIPLVEREPGFLIVNPGSPTDRRRQPHHTMAVLTLVPGREPEVEVIRLDPP